MSTLRQDDIWICLSIMLAIKILWFVAAAATTAAAPLYITDTINNTTEPCAYLEQWYNQTPANQTFAALGEYAQACLTSIPFYQDLAAQWLAELRKYVEWQSTLDILRQPPATYQSPPVDIQQGLDDISAKINASQYQSQYDFETEVTMLIRSANDGHFSVKPCTLGIFDFSLDLSFALVSISSDGIKAPKIYALNDLAQLSLGDDTVSPVVSINGTNATEYLVQVSSDIGYQDPDARFNAALANFASTVTGGTGAGQFTHKSGLWPGAAAVALEFENGTVASADVTATLMDPDTQLSGLSSGAAVFQSICMPSNPVADITARSEPTLEATPTSTDVPETTTEPELEASPSTIKPPLSRGPVGYPEPAVRDPYNQIMGFYPVENDDTAVLFIPTFMPYGDDLPANQSAVFAETAALFLREAVTSGRTKLIIDVSDNGGGSIVRAFDLFKQLFPTEFPYSATRIRRHRPLELLAKTLVDVNRTAAENVSLAYQQFVTPDQLSDFGSLQEWLGDAVQYDTHVSSLYANFNYTVLSRPAEPIAGFGSTPESFEQPPFASENILIVGNGECSSTCATFVNLMVNIGNVRTLVFGGVPGSSPMQIMGGVRGAQSQSAIGIASFVQDALNVGNTDLLTAAEFQEANATVPRALERWPYTINDINVNLRNAYQKDDDELPQQFQYQAADCRLYYTAENIVQPATAWEAAREAVWGTGACIPGSTGGMGSRKQRNSTTV
jgi:hypothetical protein